MAYDFREAERRERRQAEANLQSESKRIKRVLKRKLRALGHKPITADLRSVSGIYINLKVKHQYTGASYRSRKPSGKVRIVYEVDGWRTKSRVQPKNGFDDDKLTEVANEIAVNIQTRRSQAQRRQVLEDNKAKSQKAADKLNKRLPDGAWKLEASESDAAGKVKVLDLTVTPARAKRIQDAVWPILKEQNTEDYGDDD